MCQCIFNIFIQLYDYIFTNNDLANNFLLYYVIIIQIQQNIKNCLRRNNYFIDKYPIT